MELDIESYLKCCSTAAVTEQDEYVTALEQQLLLYQQHEEEVVNKAVAEITTCQDDLFREQEAHEQTKQELKKTQQQLARILPSLQSLSQRLKVCPAAAAVACHHVFGSGPAVANMDVVLHTVS